MNILSSGFKIGYIGAQKKSPKSPESKRITSTDIRVCS